MAEDKGLKPLPDLPFDNALTDVGREMFTVLKGLHDYVYNRYKDQENRPPHIATILNMLSLSAYTTIDFTDELDWSTGYYVHEEINKLSDRVHRLATEKDLPINKITKAINRALKETLGDSVEHIETSTDPNYTKNKLKDLVESAPEGKGVIAIELDGQGKLMKIHNAKPKGVRKDAAENNKESDTDTGTGD